MKIDLDDKATWFVASLFVLTFFGLCFMAALYVDQNNQPKVIRVEFGAVKKIPERVPGVLRENWPTQPKIEQMEKG